MSISSEFALTLIIQIVILAFFAGIYVATIKSMGKQINDITDGLYNHQKKMDETLRADRKDIKETLRVDKQELKETLRADKQELKEEMRKYNNMLERMIIVEQSTKSAHKREDEMNIRVSKLEQK